MIPTTGLLALIIEPIHSRVLNQYRRPFKPTTVQRRLPSRRLDPIHLRQPHTPLPSRQRLPIHGPVALRSGIRVGWCGYVAHAGPVQQPVSAGEIPRRHAGGCEVVVADDGQAGRFDLGDRVVDLVAGEGVEVGLAVADRHSRQDLRDVEEGGGGADGHGDAAGRGTAGVVLGATAQGDVGEGSGWGGKGGGAWGLCLLEGWVLRLG